MQFYLVSAPSTLLVDDGSRFSLSLSLKTSRPENQVLKHCEKFEFSFIFLRQKNQFVPFASLIFDLDILKIF